MDLEILKKRFTKIYQAQSDAIFRFCFLRMSDRERAIDTAEETFTRLWQKFADPETGRAFEKSMSNPKAFLFTVAHHLIIDWYRAHKTVSLESLTTEKVSGTESVDPPGEISLNASTDDVTNGSEGRLLLERLNELETTDREVLYLRFVEGLPPADIAKVLDISSNAASVRVNRGLKKLRTLAGYDNAD